MPAITPAIISTMQGYANVDDTKAATQQRILQTIAMQRQMQMDDRMQQVMLQDMVAGQQVPKSASVGDQMEQSIGYDQNNPLVQTVSDIQQQMQSTTKLLNAAKQAYNFPMVQKLNEDVSRQMTNLREAQGALYKDIEEKSKETANILAGVHDQDSLDSALNHIATNIGPQQAQKVMKLLPRDNTGRPVWDDNGQAAKALAPVVKQYEGIHDQMLDKQGQDRIVKQAQEHQDLQSWRHTMKVNQDRSFALAQTRENRLKAKDDKEKKDLTTSQKRTNDEIDEARQQLAAYNEEELAPYFDAMAEQNVLNPRMQKLLDSAIKKKYGEDPDYDATIKALSPVKFADRRKVESKFKSDNAMKGKHLGNMTSKGYEVIDENGKVIGYYGKKEESKQSSSGTIK